ncbi:MAG TPA: class I SAM-dependent methyltransferase [Bacillota bacterium]|nr:class I SAM-dependent methyltransferase [Bacillota bacterium]
MDPPQVPGDPYAGMVEHFDQMAQTGWGTDLEAAFIEFLEPASFWRCLEAGCGPGRFSLRLAERVTAVVGTDRSDAMIHRARANAIRDGVGNARFEVAALESLPGPLRGTFDLVVAIRLLFFLPDPMRGLRQMVATAAPGGWVAVCNPHARMSVDVAASYAEANGIDGFARESLAGWARVAARHLSWDEEAAVTRLQEVGLTEVTAQPALEGLGLFAKGRRPAAG